MAIVELDRPVDGRVFALFERMLGDVHVLNVLQHAAELVKEALDAERATVYVVRGDTQELEAAAVIGNVARTIHLPICRQSLAGFCALSGKSFVIPDAYGDLSCVDPALRFDRSWDQVNGFRTRDVLCAPVIFKGEVLGVVQAINHRSSQFRGDDIAMLQPITRPIAYSLYHARLYDELESLKCLKREKANFMRIMVHELKSPVAAAKMMATALQYTNRENVKVCDTVSKIESRMDHLLTMVEDILNLSQVNSGNPLGEVVVCDLVNETRPLVETYREQAEGKGLALNIGLHDRPLSVRFDRKGYHLILSNLLSNAVKYTPAGSVNVSLGPDGEWSVLKVADTGMGIPAQDLPSMFGEFFRASNARAGAIKGTGVGLAGAKELVERFGGNIGLESVENAGSTFTVRLPLHQG